MPQLRKLANPPKERVWKWYDPWGLSGTIGALVVPAEYCKDDIFRANDVEDGMIDKIFQEGSEDLLGDVDATGDAEVG